eukprot:TRINITY_DN5689_c0_g1_i10.p1 TRINITY_DN5689_c0_g1~~TRINITY_DN5689_c0_g1_i10.p1  ORF type:complete len:149 (-),score=10.72 TRINITY_DN5689_c0_g1_i10:237-683(-)
MRNFTTNAHRLSELEIARQRCKQRLLVPSDCSQSNHQLSAVNIDWQQDFELCSSEVVQFVVRMYKRAVHHWYWRTPMVTTFGSGGYDTKTPRPVGLYNCSPVVFSFYPASAVVARRTVRHIMQTLHNHGHRTDPVDDDSRRTRPHVIG